MPSGLWGFPDSSVGKESACNAGDLGSIPGLGRSPGEGKGCPLQYSGLENSMDCIVHGVAKSWTQLSNFHFPSFDLLHWPQSIVPGVSALVKGSHPLAGHDLDGQNDLEEKRVRGSLLDYNRINQNLFQEQQKLQREKCAGRSWKTQE